MKKIIAIIPARYESSRFIGKPLALIRGKPMIRLVYESVLQSAYVDEIYVATDDKRIYDEVVGFDGKVIMTSSSHESGTDRIAEAIRYLKLTDQDIVVNVQGDQPFVNHKCINNLIKPFYSKTNLKMTTLVFPIKSIVEINDPKNVKAVFDLKGYAIYFSRSMIPFNRDSSEIQMIYKHLGLYAYRKSFLETFAKLPVGRLEQIEKLEQLRPIEHGYRIFVSVSPYDSPEVDIPKDIEKLEKQIN